MSGTVDPQVGGAAKTGLYFTHIKSSFAQSWEIAPFKWGSDFADKISYMSLSSGYLWGCGICPACNTVDDNGLVTRLKVNAATAPVKSDLIAA